MNRILLILALALVLRFGVVWLLRGQLTADRDAYLAIAENLAAGRGYSSVPGKPTAYRPPSYPLILAPAVAVARPEAGVAAVNLLAGLLAVWITFCLSRRLGLGRSAYMAAAVVAVDPLLVQYAAQPMTEVLAAALVAAFVWSAVRVPRNQDREPGIAWRSILTGVLFGVAALCRPALWLAGGLLVIWSGLLWLRGRRDNAGTWPAGICCALGVVFVVSPWVVRNWSVFGRPILTTTHGGYTLLLANNPVFYREVVDRPWGALWSEGSLREWNAGLEAALRAENPPVEGEVARDRWMSARARQHMVEQPGMFVRACWLRFRMFWNVAPLDASTEVIEDAWRRACDRMGWRGGAAAAKRVAAGMRWAVAAFYVAVTVAFVIGLVRLRGEWRQWMPLLIVIAAFTAVHLVYWTNTRMRAPVVPLIAVVAGRAVERRQAPH